MLPEGTPSADSSLIKAEMPTPQAVESISLDQLSKARAERIWALVIKLFLLYNELN